MMETIFLTQAPTIRSEDVSIVLVKYIKHNPLTVIKAHLTQDINACKETKSQNNEGQGGKCHTDAHNHRALRTIGNSHDEKYEGIKQKWKRERKDRKLM